jgi:hypothetical protein
MEKLLMARFDVYANPGSHAEELLLETPKMGAVPQRGLEAPLKSLTQEQNQITAALIFCFTASDHLIGCLPSGPPRQVCRRFACRHRPA